jgi:NAD(P)-dependent dehydrogenase (short-subunit alcohol dehydrogenase family)
MLAAVTGEFEGMSAIVTGGGSGIGRATVEELVARGARVASLDLSPAAPTPGVEEISADVADEQSTRAAVDHAAELLGGIDVVVNNAGIGAHGTVEESPDEEFLRLFQVNVLGLVHTSRAALPHLRRSEHPAIVNTCSVAAWTGLQQRAAYSTSKGAVQALTLAMAADHVREGIRVNCVNPGTADTPWVQRLLASAPDPEVERASLEARQPLGRLVSAQEVANAICYLASPRSGSTTGTLLGVDGGSHSLLITR